MLCGVKNQRRARTEQLRGFGGYDCAVGQFYRRARIAATVAPLLGSHGDTARVGVDSRLIEEQPYFLDLVSIVGTAHKFVCGVVIATDYLVAACIAAHFIVVDAEADHVDAHIRGRLVWILTVYPLEQCVEHRKNLDVAIVVDGGLSVSFQMERVYHVHIVEVGGRRLVCDIDRMLEGETPHRESLEFGISGLNSATILVIQLREAHRHLS